MVPPDPNLSATSTKYCIHDNIPCECRADVRRTRFGDAEGSLPFQYEAELVLNRSSRATSKARFRTWKAIARSGEERTAREAKLQHTHTFCTVGSDDATSWAVERNSCHCTASLLGPWARLVHSSSSPSVHSLTVVLIATPNAPTQSPSSHCRYFECQRQEMSRHRPRVGISRSGL